MPATYKRQREKYSFIGFYNMLKNAVDTYGYTALSNQSGIARSTLHRIIDGTFSDISLSTAQKISIAIIFLKKDKKTLAK